VAHTSRFDSEMSLIVLFANALVLVGREAVAAAAATTTTTTMLGF